MSLIIDGKAIAQTIRQDIQEKVKYFNQTGEIPGLAVILVGNNPSSEVYVNMKAKACQEVGIHSVTERLAGDVSETELLQRVYYYNQNPKYQCLWCSCRCPLILMNRKL